MIGPAGETAPVTEPAKRMGRKDLRRDPEVMKRLEDALIAGNSYRNAAALSGIGLRSFYRWKAEGEKAKPGSLAFGFYDLIRRAESAAIHRNVMVIQKATSRSWQAAAWWLERKCPEDWGRKDFIRTEHSGVNGAPIRTETTEVPPHAPISEDERRELLKRTYERTFGIPHSPGSEPERADRGEQGEASSAS